MKIKWEEKPAKEKGQGGGGGGGSGLVVALGEGGHVDSEFFTGLKKVNWIFNHSLSPSYFIHNFFNPSNFKYVPLIFEIHISCLSNFV